MLLLKWGVLVIVRYVQEALKFKLHFNSRLNAEEATCEKCLHMCGTLVTVLLLLLSLLLLLLLPLLLLLNSTSGVEAVAVAKIALPFTQVECRIGFEHCSYKMHWHTASVRFWYVVICFFWRLVDCLFSAGE